MITTHKAHYICSTAEQQTMQTPSLSLLVSLKYNSVNRPLPEIYHRETRAQKLNKYSQLAASVHFSCWRFHSISAAGLRWKVRRGDPPTLTSESSHLSSLLSPKARPYYVRERAPVSCTEWQQNTGRSAVGEMDIEADNLLSTFSKIWAGDVVLWMPPVILKNAGRPRRNSGTQITLRLLPVKRDNTI